MNNPGYYTLRAMLVGAAALLLNACAPIMITGGADVDNQAFGPKKRFAVVSISAMKTFEGEKGFTQMFKSDEDIPGTNSQPLVNAVRPKVIRALAKNPNLVLVSEKQVLASRAYRAIEEDKREVSVMFFSDEVNVAKGYKYLKDPKKFARLARELNVDGVIGVHMAFSVTANKGHLNINGLSFGRKAYTPNTMMTAVAYDREGKQIWEDTTMKQADPADKKAIFLIDFSDLADTDFRKMHPKAIEMGGKAMNELLARLDDTLAGKGSSSLQSVK